MLHQLGQSAVHLTQAGGRFRDYFLGLAQADDLQVEWVDSFSEIHTCTTLLDVCSLTSTEIVAEAEPVGVRTETDIQRRFQELLPTVELVVLSWCPAKCPESASRRSP